MDGTGFTARTVSLLSSLVLLAFACGCQSGSGQQASFANPFQAPDRVPPPTTRSITPGSAQPYYPGDPVPSLQGGAPASPAMYSTPTVMPAQQAPITPITSTATTPANRMAILPAQQQPLQSAAQPAAGPRQTPSVSMTHPVQPAAYDQSSAMANQASSATYQAQPAQSHQQSLSGQQIAEMSDSGFSRPAYPEAADPRVAVQPQPSIRQQPPQQEPAPWRSPAVSHRGPAAGQSANDGYQQVEIRPMGTAPTTTTAPANPAPRIRLPGSAQSAASGQLAPARRTSQPGAPQTVAVTELPPYPSGGYAAPQANAQSPWQEAPASTASTTRRAPADGFRPRSNLR